ncbi:MAG TPA: hypothetical protein ENG22_03070 [Candidatus Bathyarchaeota archaeon]|nr:hypothetical protein [Candidatus Bathyarchaeota archaeon]
MHWRHFIKELSQVHKFLKEVYDIKGFDSMTLWAFIIASFRDVYHGKISVEDGLSELRVLLTRIGVHMDKEVYENLREILRRSIEKVPEKKELVDRKQRLLTEFF